MTANVAARPSDRPTRRGYGHFGRIDQTPTPGWAVSPWIAVCDDCPWTGKPHRTKDAARFQWYEHHAETTPALSPPLIPILQPAEQPGLF